jgi:hypothetical protein
VRAALLAALAVAAALSPVIAGDPKIAHDGTVHSVVAGLDSGASSGGSNALLHFEQSPSGETLVRTVANQGWCSQPSLAIDPQADEPVVVWTRTVQGVSDIYVSRFEGQGWSAPRAVTDDAAGDTRPTILIGSTLVHVIWERISTTGDSPQLFIVALDRVSLAPASVPIALPTAGVNVIPLDGGGHATAIAPVPNETLFAAGAPDGANGRILIVFGIREEPMPVGYCQGFALPPGVADVANARVDRVAMRVVLSFVSGGQLWYAILDDGAWIGWRRIDLAATSAAEARQRIADMLEDAEPGSLE